jgi:hypothetical protein
LALTTLLETSNGRCLSVALVLIPRRMIPLLRSRNESVQPLR